tara:strand:- start:838 stop:1281 length:444 start_codon:yes stop_codon:yes gene_type:complete
MKFITSDGIKEIEAHREGSIFNSDGNSVDIQKDIWLEMNGKRHKVVATKVGDCWWLHVQGYILRYELVEEGVSNSQDDSGLTAPMPGKILDVNVSVGDSVKKGDVLLVMEAMKMEHKIIAVTDGIVESVNYSVGDQVSQGAELLIIE